MCVRLEALQGGGGFSGISNSLLEGDNPVTPDALMLHEQGRVMLGVSVNLMVLQWVGAASIRHPFLQLLGPVEDDVQLGGPEPLGIDGRTADQGSCDK